MWAKTYGSSLPVASCSIMKFWRWGAGDFVLYRWAVNFHWTPDRNRIIKCTTIHHTELLHSKFGDEALTSFVYNDVRMGVNMQKISQSEHDYTMETLDRRRTYGKNNILEIIQMSACGNYYIYKRPTFLRKPDGYNKVACVYMNIFKYNWGGRYVG